jgi:hypothetical protein
MKTTKAMFKFFKERCRYWAGEISCMNWRIRYEHRPCDLPDTNAEVAYDLDAHQAVIRLNTVIDQDLVDELAFHEIHELKYAKMRELALREQRPTQEEVNATVHELIAIDANNLFDKEDK